MNSDLRSSGGTTTASPPHDTALSTRGIRVSYGHVHALRGADFDCRAGEVTALIGDNGAGKSTLVKVLSGSLAPDDVQVYVGGEPFRANGPTDAQAAGI